MTDIKVYVDNIGEYVTVPGGSTLSDLLDRVRPELKFEPICAHVNNKTEDLQYPVFAPKKVEFVGYDNPSGQRCYIRSLCMLLYRAVETLYPGTVLTIKHSISRGYYCKLSCADGSVMDASCSALKDEMRSLVTRNLPFNRHERLTEHVIKIFEKQGLKAKVKLLKTLHELYTVYYDLDGLCDTYNSALAPSTGLLKTWDLKDYEQGFLLLGPDERDFENPHIPLPQPKMFKAFTRYLDFNSIIGIHDAGDVNQLAERKETAMMINVAEALHGKYITAIADEITRRFHQGGAKVVLVAGPSSSGKTTFTKRLAVQLVADLIKPVMISLDDYFVNREDTPRDETGDYDYESIYALDLKLFNEHLKRLISGEEVRLPYYNFELGIRQFRDQPIKLKPNSVLLIEGIHGLNPELTASIDDKMKYRVYVSALTTLAIDEHNWVSTTDNRLLRRIIRDHKYRGCSALETIRRWPSVRRGEQKWIFPYQENADTLFNSSLLFEMGVMRQQAEEALREVPRDVPEYAEAYRLRRFLEYFLPIGDHLIPPTSLLREFLGGSSFHY